MIEIFATVANSRTFLCSIDAACAISAIGFFCFLKKIFCTLETFSTKLCIGWPKKKRLQYSEKRNLITNNIFYSICSLKHCQIGVTILSILILPKSYVPTKY